MIKDDIEYRGKSCQVSTIELYGIYETMCFPVIGGVVSGNEVYKYRSCDRDDVINKHFDIAKHPEKYLDKKILNNIKNQ